MSNVVVVALSGAMKARERLLTGSHHVRMSSSAFRGTYAGHTLVVNGTAYKLSLCLQEWCGTPSIVGNGVVVDPWALLTEIDTVRQQGVSITPDILMIAENCPLILPLHSVLDRAVEDAAGKGRIGTTGRGSAPLTKTKLPGGHCVCVILSMSQPLRLKLTAC